MLDMSLNMEALTQYGTVPIDYATLVTNLGSYKSPKDKVSKLEKSGKIIRLKKGLYVISPDLSKQILSEELIANHLSGPSYISFETALSYYGLIPERVYTVKSATTKRKKVYHTPIGIYEYITVPEDYFSIGLTQKIIQDSYAFVIATPEKALCDMILSTSGLRFQSKKAIDEYLWEDIRINIHTAGMFNTEIIHDCSRVGYKKTELNLLYEALENINTRT